MSKFIIKHGCCYVPTVDSATSISTASTFQVYANPEFKKTTPSEAVCEVEDANNILKRNPPQESWDELKEETGDTNDCLQSCNNEMHTCKSNSTGEDKYEDGNLRHRNKFVTLYGTNPEFDKNESERGFIEKVSDQSVYRPTTRPKDIRPTSSERILDCISLCFWKCSSWCQKID